MLKGALTTYPEAMKPGLRFEKIADTEFAVIEGVVTDVHNHPRLFDPLFPLEPGIPNGKAGIRVYSKTALLNGIGRGLFMPNESQRLPNPEQPDMTELLPYPIANEERLRATLSMINESSLMIGGMIVGVDRESIGLGDQQKGTFTTQEIKRFFASSYVRDFAAALKIFGDESTGGYNIPLEFIIPVGEVWHEFNPNKPVVLHLEDEHVGQILDVWPNHIPVHIAHVTSRLELEAVIRAKQNGKNVTCEATPHHLFLTEGTKDSLGATGCMKPSLKSLADQKFLWDNLEYIDMFASDCAPHRLIDKVDVYGNDLAKPAFGVTNHDVFIPLFLQAVQDGKISESELYEKIVINPAKRFNLPVLEGYAKYEMLDLTAEDVVRRTPYGVSPFPATPEELRMAGRLQYLQIAGKVAVASSRLHVSHSPSYQKLIRF